MNDEETVALVAGGHTFGKTHGAACRFLVLNRKVPASRNRVLAGIATSAPARVSTQSPAVLRKLDAKPIKWDNGYFDMLFGYEWELTKIVAVPISGLRQMHLRVILRRTHMTLTGVMRR